MFRDSFKRGFFDGYSRRESRDPASGNEIIARFGETLAPLIDRFGEEAIESIVTVMTRIVEDDWQSATTLLENSASIVESLLESGEDFVLKTFGLADQVVSYGAPVAVKFLEMSARILHVSDYETLAKTAGLSCVVARADIRTAMALLDTSPAILERLGFDGLERVGALASAVAASTWTNAIRAVEAAPTQIDRLLEAGDAPLALAVYELAGQIAPGNWSHALELLEYGASLVTAFTDGEDEGSLSQLLKDAGELAPFGGRLTLAYLHRAPELMDGLSPETFESFRQCLLAVAAVNSKNARSLLEMTTEHTKAAFQNQPSETTTLVFDRARLLVDREAILALKFIAACAAFPGRITPEDMESLSERAQSLAEAGITVAGSFLDAAPDLVKQLGGMDNLDRIVEPGRSIALVSAEAAAKFFLQSPSLLERAGLSGIEMVARFSTLLARESGSTATQLLEKCPAILDDILSLGHESAMADLCSLGSRIALYNARLAVSLIENSAAIVRLVGFSGLEQMEELIHEVGSESWTTAVSLLQTSPAILERVGFEGLKRIAETARGIARQNNYGAVSLVQASPERIDQLTELGTTELALHVYDLARQASNTSWRLAAALVEKSHRLVVMTGPEGLDALCELMGEVAQSNGRVATRALDLSSIIVEMIGSEGFELLARLAAVLSNHDEAEAIAMVEKSPDLIAAIAAARDRSAVLLVFEAALNLARISPPLALRFLDKCSHFLDWGGLEGLGMIVSFLESTARDDEAKALSFLESDQPEFSDFMENIPRGLELKSVLPVLSSYLRALLGRSVEISAGDKVSTDGRKIILPRRVREYRDDRDNFTFYKVAATHQEAHLEYGSFEFDLEKIEKLVSRICERYGRTADEEESDLERFVTLFPEPDLARDLFNLLEDMRINAILKREYPALGSEITRMNRHELKKRSSLKKIPSGKQHAMEALGQVFMGRRTFGADEASPDLLKHFRTWRSRLSRKGSDVHVSARGTSDLYDEIHNRYSEPYRSIAPLSEHLDQNQAAQNMGSFGKASRRIEEALRGKDSSSRGSAEGQREAQSGAEGDRRPTDKRPGRDDIGQRPHSPGTEQKSYRGSAGQSGKAEPSEQQEDDAAGTMGGSMQYHDSEKIERLLRSAHKERGITPREIERRLESLHRNEIYLFLHNLEASLKKKTELESERGTSLYAEWGEDIQDYRASWARIREQAHPGRSLDFYRETLDRHGGLLRRIRREFQMLRPEEFTRLKGRYDGDDIDLDAVVASMIDRKAGISPSEKNYILTDRRKRDIAVAFLIDMSRSTRGATIDREKESLIMMSEALYEVGDTFSVFGFSGNNRDNVDFYIIKDFDEPYNDGVKKRISSIEHQYENRDGAAIRHATVKLRKRQERTKLIILLSDGKPVDKDYSGTYAIEDTRMALREAGHYGINTFCITVDKEAAEYLPRMYSHSRWTVIDDVAKLPEKITRIYRRLTA